MKESIKRIIVIIFIVLIAIFTFISTRGSFLEYKELGEKYVSIFKTNLTYRYTIMAINFLVTFTIMFFTNRGIKKGLKVFFDEEKKEMPKLFNKSISLVIAVISSIVVGIVFTPKVILYASNVSFEKTDLIFNLDISFYMFLEPLIKMGLIYIMIILAFLIVYSMIYYILVFNKYFEGIDKETLKNSFLVKHIIKHTRFLSIVFAIYTLIGTLDIVFSGFITTSSKLQLTGAGVTDVTIKIVGNIIFSILIVISIFMATSNLKKGNKSKLIKNILVIPAYLVFMFVVMVGFDLIYVSSNKYDKEKKYIERNIEYTKQAYGINAENETIDYSGTITTDEIKENRNILDNAVIINKKQALEKLNQEQSEKGYYTYVTAGIDKYTLNDNIKLVYVSPREILNNKRTYNSKTFEYTHGYGAILTSATSTTEDGDIEYLKNEVLESNYIKTPQIYYGLKTDNAVAVGETNQKEYDYTDNKENEYTSSYNGNSGLKLGFFDRLILGIKTQNIGLFFSGQITNNTKILINRNIIKRAKLVLPNVIYDENPYVVVNNNGEMFWVLDAYTISSNYPYSTYTNIRYDGERKTINYIRNSIKVIINCYDGSMKYYITDETDPVAMAYRKVYPNIFENINTKIPEDISEKFVYPKFLYDIQASMLEEYHNTKSEVLYRGDDSWKKTSYVATQNNKTVNTTLDSYYTMVEGENIGLIQMYSPNGKQSLTAYLTGTVEKGKNKLKINKISSGESILGLTQLDSKISQDENMKAEIDALTVTGAKITKNIMVVPVENTIIYIEQIYQTKTNESDTRLLKKVVVASGNKMAIGNNLEESLENLVSQEATSFDINTTEDLNGIIESIIKANKNLSNSMNSKNWELIGSDINALQGLIDTLEVQHKKDKEKNKADTNINNNTIINDNIIQNNAIDNMSIGTNSVE